MASKKPDETEPEVTGKRSYRVLLNLHHGGKLFLKGGIVQLTGGEAEPLLESKHVKAAK